MKTIRIFNIGELFTGVLANPRGTATSLLVADGRIASLDPPASTNADIVIDAHGGTTTMVSAGELHVPGLDYANLTADLVTSLAVVTRATTGRLRWSGVKMHAGTVLLVPGMREEHFDRLAAAGSILATRVGGRRW